jgi:hypothetical protein
MGHFWGDCGGRQHGPNDESHRREGESERSRRQGDYSAESRDTDDCEDGPKDEPGAAVKSADIFCIIPFTGPI